MHDRMDAGSKSSSGHRATQGAVAEGAIAESFGNATNIRGLCDATAESEATDYPAEGTV